MSALIEAAVAVMKLTPRVFFAASVFGTFILLAPNSIATALGFSDFRAEYSKWLGPGTIAAFCLWLPTALSTVWAWVKRLRESRRRRLNALAHLDTLSKEEHLLLAYFVHHDAPTQFLLAHYPPARSLCAKGLLVAAGGTGNVFNWPFTVPRNIWAELQDRRESLFPHVDSPEAAERFRRLKEEMDDRFLYGGI